VGIKPHLKPTPNGVKVWLVWLLLYAHSHRRILEAAGHIILTPAKQLMVMGLKIWFESATFQSLAHELTNRSNWAWSKSCFEIEGIHHCKIAVHVIHAFQSLVTSQAISTGVF
jgi:hypothetical protein